jgi:hypothetical protein
MKKILLLLSVFIIGLMGCVKDDFDNPNQYVDPKLPVNYTIKELKQLYQESRDFEYYDKTIYHIKRNLLSNYIKRYIQKSLSIVPPEQNRILVDIYNLYISDPSNNRISLEYINDYLNNLSTPLLYNLYKQYQKRRSLYGNGNYVDEDTKKKVLNSYYKEQ